MKYCRNCGAELTDDNHICPAAENLQVTEVPQKKWSVMSIIAFSIAPIVFVLNLCFTIWNFTIDDIGFLVVWLLGIATGFPTSIVSTTLSIVAVCITVKRKKKGKALAIASLVMSAVAFCLSLAVFIYPFILKIIS